ncbi:MAG: hypothetical protein IPP61_11920 [Cytophagaceae bacterium]|nr:hypothetical protein [Cytophagaceae bacterium]
MKNLSFILFLLTSYISIAQSAKKAYKQIENSPNINDFTNYLEKYPDSKYSLIVTTKQQCLRRNIDWENASKTNTIVGYSQFLEKYENLNLECSIENWNVECPNQTNQAKNNKYCLTHISDWKLTSRADDISHYNEFCKKYENPLYNCDGSIVKNIEYSRKKISCLQEISDWRIAKLGDDSTSYATYLIKYETKLLELCASKVTSNVEYAKSSLLQIEENKMWISTKKQNSIAEFSNFISKYPNSTFSKIAMAEIENIKNWKIAKNANSHKYLSDYLITHANSQFADSAKVRLEIIEKSDWRKALKIHTYKGYSDFQKKYPNGFYYNKAEDQIVEMEIQKAKKQSPLSNWLPMEIFDSKERDKEFSSISMKNNTDYTIYIVLSGVDKKRLKIKSKENATFKVRNGQYTLSASVIGISNVKPFWGEEKFVGFEYSSTWKIQTEIDKMYENMFRNLEVPDMQKINPIKKHEK